MDWLFPFARLFSSPEPMLALVVGVAFGILFGLLPGINGKKGIILSIPFIAGLDPATAVVYLVAMHAVVQTCGSLPAVLVGLPTSTSEAAVVLDGYPLVKQGRAWEAIAATIGGSAVGGLIGALALIAFIPVGLLLVPYIGSPEILGITLIGLLAISSLSGRSLARGLIVAALGLLAATVGFDGLTGAKRYTFDQLTLAPGINIAAVLAGLFVIPEMLTLGKQDESANVPMRGMGLWDIVRGMAVAIQRFGIVFRSSLIGVVVGFIPGIGSAVSVWMAYGHAVQTEPNDPPFGEGNVAGVLAAEAANNAKEGGSFAPTLMFAVPGSSGMAIMMLAFTYIGIDVGPRLVKSDPGFVSMVGWVILLANLVAIPVCLLFLPTFSFIATLKQRAVMPVALILSIAAAIVVMPHPISLLQIAIFGAVGLALKLAHWPRAPLLLGFVMGPIIESTLWRTVNVFGLSAFERPGLILLLVILVTALAWSRVKARKRQKVDIHSPPSPVLGLDGLGLVLFASAAYAAFAFPPPARLFPVGASILGFCCCLVVLLEDLSARNYWSEWKAWREVELDALLPALGLVAASPLVGFPFAALLYVPLALLWSARTRLAYALLAGAGAATAAYALVQDPIGLMRPFNALWRMLVWL